MQPLLEPPRDTLTSSAVTALIRDSASVVMGIGCGLTDITFTTVEDITKDVSSGSVSRSFYDTIHGSAEFSITRDIPFGYAVLLPWCTLSDGVTTARFDLGAYFTDTPRRPLAERPVTYRVKCTDILKILNTSIGDAFMLPAGTNYLAAALDIITGRGVPAGRIVVDQSAASSVLPNERSWTLQENVTWLTVVNDLLASINYQGLWTDWAGRFRLSAYQSPRDRAVEFAYDTDPETSLIAPEREEEYDYENAPNSWLFVRSNGIEQAPPEDGNGIYRYDNERDGPTSQEARKRTIMKGPIFLDVPDHAALVASAQRTIDADKLIPLRYNVSTFPVPLHWHSDVMSLRDADRGPDVKAHGTQWTLPLDGSDMTHEWQLLV